MLEALTRFVGCPLVLKLDNGAAFIGDELRAWAQQRHVLLLYSPPGTPEYNGSIEAGGGSMQARTYHEAARHDRPGHWTCDDVEAARLQANETGRPWGPGRPTPREAWNARRRIVAVERAAFLAAYRHHADAERQARGWHPGVELPHRDQAAIDRVAIAQTLIEQGLLNIRRRRITLPIWKRFAANIS